jgi:hypothetical protein
MMLKMVVEASKRRWLSDWLIDGYYRSILFQLSGLVQLVVGSCRRGFLCLAAYYVPVQTDDPPDDRWVMMGDDDEYDDDDACFPFHPLSWSTRLFSPFFFFVFFFPRFVSASRTSQEAYQFATNQTSPNKRPPLQAQRHPSIITIWLPFPLFFPFWGKYDLKPNPKRKTGKRNETNREGKKKKKKKKKKKNNNYLLEQSFSQNKPEIISLAGGFERYMIRVNFSSTICHYFPCFYLLMIIFNVFNLHHLCFRLSASSASSLWPLLHTYLPTPLPLNDHPAF